MNIKSNVAANKDSNSKLAVQDEEGNWVVPFVIEPSAGVERGFLAILNEAYNVENLDDGNSRVVLKLKPHLAPVKVAVIPLKKNNEDIVNLAKEVKVKIQRLGLGRIIFENTGNIGKSYRKHDEIGTPMCITVDFESLENKTVTIRDRDSMAQSRIDISKIPSFVESKIKS